jgi:hypothetical protein
MRNRNYLFAVFAIYLLLLSASLVPAAFAAPAPSLAVGAANFSLNGEYSPRSRCRDEAKRMWKRCRERDRRPNGVCDMEYDRRRRECDRFRH